MAAAPGWYPDPDGTPGRLRYWDGQQWSTRTSDNAAPQAPISPHRSKRRGPIIIAAAAFIVLVLVVVLTVRTFSSHRESVIRDPDPPQSTVTGWNDSSPLPTATPTPSKSSKPSPSASFDKVACAIGQPLARAHHPHDGRLYGGQLSIPSPDSSWLHSNRDAVGLSFAYDVGLVDKVVTGDWYESLSVGEVHAEDGFHTPRQAADGITQCIASSSFYRGFSGREDVFSKAISVDGKQAWALRTKISVDDPSIDVEGDVSEVIVVDTGQSDTLSFFWGCVPIGDATRLKQMAAVMSDLTVS